MTKEIFVPGSLRLLDVIEFARTLDSLPDEGDVVVDFDAMKIVGPFALLLLSSAFDRQKIKKPKLKILPRHYAHASYAAHMGFFRAIGVNFGRLPSNPIGNENFLSITVHGLVALRREAVDLGIPMGELAQEEANKLAGILSRTSSGPLFDVFEYTIREIIRNTVEHSRSTVVEWCAQYWPKMDKVEIAILDRGIGVAASLRANPTLPVKNDRNALDLALLPGISRNVFAGAPNPSVNIWQNSGFGLYMTSRLCREGGDFFIGSGDSGVFLKAGQKSWYRFGFEGTAVRMVIRPSRIGNLKKTLGKFASDGEKFAKEIKVKLPEASTASKMIRTDFGRHRQ
jgi:hypothetical protein